MKKRNKIDIYDEDGRELFSFSVWELTDGEFGLGNSDYKFAKSEEKADIQDFISLLP